MFIESTMEKLQQDRKEYKLANHILKQVYWLRTLETKDEDLKIK